MLTGASSWSLLSIDLAFGVETQLLTETLDLFLYLCSKKNTFLLVKDLFLCYWSMLEIINPTLKQDYDKFKVKKWNEMYYLCCRLQMVPAAVHLAKPSLQSLFFSIYLSCCLRLLCIMHCQKCSSNVKEWVKLFMYGGNSEHKITNNFLTMYMDNVSYFWPICIFCVVLCELCFAFIFAPYPQTSGI